MNDDLFNFLDLKEFLNDSFFLNPLKENYSDYLFQLLDRAVDKWENDETELAIQLCDEFTAQTKDIYIGEFLKLAIQLKEIDVEEKLSTFESINPDIFKTKLEKVLFHFFKACLYFVNHDIDEARKECDLVIGLEGSLYYAYYIKAQCYALRELHSLAIPAYLISLKGDYRIDEIKVNLAYSYLRNQDNWKALRLHKKVVDKFPENYKVQYNTGLCYKRFKRYKKAIKYFDRALKIHQSTPSFYLTRGRVLMKIKEHKEAQNDLLIASNNNIAIAKELLKINELVLSGDINSRKAEMKVKELLRRTTR
ncbi:tetratricopeptide repeat protein [Flavivirga spongiicola]|uniref:Tetratricopeptide repeat protein n=1 Tax=Flavivirga spongiicola TaxID=421621 RepID=A0ABU7XW84_9FLAO|nr:tetratricopeptide repeat protein [Flavivirga sp. MEBiC05379]MDO5979200.1 tetratricopeptide repeat protein [Flavivirga sp. MEBiC05379]